MAFSNFKSVGQVIAQYPLKINKKEFLPDASIDVPEWFLENLKFSLQQQAEN